ncbi:MAG: hypothetical protein ACTHKB_07975 [Burkholderiaceae bacterium]
MTSTNLVVDQGIKQVAHPLAAGDLKNLFRSNHALLNPPGCPDRASTASIIPSQISLSCSPLHLRSSRNTPLSDSLQSTSSKRRLLRALVAFGIAAFGMHGAFAADWYVDGKYGNDSSSGSSSAAFKTVWKAWSRAQPGDTVHLRPTITYGPIWLGGKSGYSGKNITLKGDGSSSNMTKVSGNWQNHAIVIEDNRSYITIQNLDVTAPGHSSNSPYSAILVPRNHHVWVLNNYTHDAGCAGIQTTNSD